MTLEAYAAGRGLYYRASSLALPQATQLLRHGFMREVTGLVRGDLPGGLNGAWLAQVAYVFEGANELQRSHFTLVLIEAPESLGFAVRLLCHDRDLSDLDMSNPQSDREIIEADDRAIRLESEAFLERYALFTDADQDTNPVWRLFAPTLIDWLTHEAPKDFSFELQDGALCCFIPGTLDEPAEIDALCEAAGRVLTEVTRIGAGSGSITPDPGNRRTRLEEQLAGHRFDSPPATVKDAARAYRRGLLIGEDGWKLGAEAFFREQAGAAGFTRIEPGEFRASHVKTFLPGLIANAARGDEPGDFAGCFLVFTNNQEFDSMGWTILVAEGRRTTGQARLPVGVSAERGLTKVDSDGRSLIFSTLDGGAHDRNSKELDSFLQVCRATLVDA